MEKQIKYGVVLINKGVSIKELWRKTKVLFGMDAIMNREIFESGSAILTISYDKEYVDAVVEEINNNEFQILSKSMVVY